MGVLGSASELISYYWEFRDFFWYIIIIIKSIGLLFWNVVAKFTGKLNFTVFLLPGSVVWNYFMNFHDKSIIYYTEVVLVGWLIMQPVETGLFSFGVGDMLGRSDVWLPFYETIKATMSWATNSIFLESYWVFLLSTGVAELLVFLNLDCGYCLIILISISSVSVCHRKDGRCRGHQTGPGLCGNGKSKLHDYKQVYL